MKQPTARQRRGLSRAAATLGGLGMALRDWRDVDLAFLLDERSEVGRSYGGEAVDLLFLDALDEVAQFIERLQCAGDAWVENHG